MQQQLKAYIKATKASTKFCSLQSADIPSSIPTELSNEHSTGDQLAK